MTSVTPLPIARAHLRIARPTNDIAALLPFYVTGLGFSVVSSFEKHEGFEGIMLGHEGAGYHLEFTTAEGHDAGRAPTQDNLLIFYIPGESAHAESVARMEAAGFVSVASFNPWWDRLGKTFEDPDGYRVVLAKGDWQNTAKAELPPHAYGFSKRGGL